MTNDEIISKRFSWLTKPSSINRASKALDLARKDEAIAFEKWKVDNKCSVSFLRPQSGQYFNINGDGIAKTIEELYSLFKKDTNGG